MQKELFRFFEAQDRRLAWEKKEKKWKKRQEKVKKRAMYDGMIWSKHKELDDECKERKELDGD